MNKEKDFINEIFNFDSFKENFKTLTTIKQKSNEMVKFVLFFIHYNELKPYKEDDDVYLYLKGVFEELILISINTKTPAKTLIQSFKNYLKSIFILGEYKIYDTLPVDDVPIYFYGSKFYSDIIINNLKINIKNIDLTNLIDYSFIQQVIDMIENNSSSKNKMKEYFYLFIFTNYMIVFNPDKFTIFSKKIFNIIKKKFKDELPKDIDYNSFVLLLNLSNLISKYYIPVFFIDKFNNLVSTKGGTRSHFSSFYFVSLLDKDYDQLTQNEILSEIKENLKLFNRIFDGKTFNQDILNFIIRNNIFSMDTMNSNLSNLFSLDNVDKKILLKLVMKKYIRMGCQLQQNCMYISKMYYEYKKIISVNYSNKFNSYPDIFCDVFDEVINENNIKNILNLKNALLKESLKNYNI